MKTASLKIAYTDISDGEIGIFNNGSKEKVILSIDSKPCGELEIPPGLSVVEWPIYLGSIICIYDSNGRLVSQKTVNERIDPIDQAAYQNTIKQLAELFAKDTSITIFRKVESQDLTRSVVVELIKEGIKYAGKKLIEKSWESYKKYGEATLEEASAEKRATIAGIALDVKNDHPEYNMEQVYNEAESRLAFRNRK